MSYQVLARKWRPKTFATMVGQEHVLQALINALDNDRLHHAYLFTGTRGVGKTTVARIFAKSLNCEKGVSSTPCGECSACREIDEGRFIDLIEVDAASRTKVEDTRELLENVQYAPTRGTYKVYLIDEVHMLSSHSFNALLKTLEEPPPHVKFLLATTDPQKLPVTILSRCLQFSLKRMSVEMISGHLRHILAQEGLHSDDGSILQVAEAADGSMRDGLSIMDQAIAHCGGDLSVEQVRTMLGSIDRSYIFKLLQALADGDGEAVLAVSLQLSQQGLDFATVLSELVSQLHKLALAQMVPGTIENQADSETLKGLAQAISPEDVQLFYQIGINGRRDLPYAPDPRTGMEMVLLRMLAFQPLDLKGLAAGSGSAKAVTPASARNSVSSARKASAIPVPGATQAEPAPVALKSDPPAPAKSAPESVVAETSVPAVALGNLDNFDDWRSIVDQLGLKAMAYQLAVNSLLLGRDGNTLQLSLAPQYATLRSPNSEQRLLEGLSNYFGGTVNVKFIVSSESQAQVTPAVMQKKEAEDRHQTAVDTMHADPQVRQICDTFDGQVIDQSVKPVGD